MSKFVEDDFTMNGEDANRIRKLLRIHPRRPIPEAIVRKYKSMWNMLASVNRGAFSRDTIAILCAMCFDITRGSLSGEKVLLVDGEDLSQEPPKPKKEKE